MSERKPIFLKPVNVRGQGDGPHASHHEPPVSRQEQWSDSIGNDQPITTLRGIKARLRSLNPRAWRKMRDYKHMAFDIHNEWRTHGVDALRKPVRSMLAQINRGPERARNSRVWLDLGDFGELLDFDAGGFQDHGVGLLRTILHQAGVHTDLASTRTMRTWQDVREQIEGYDMLLMNVRSYTYSIAVEAARIFKQVNPRGIVVTGGMHAAVSPQEMEATELFDKICLGPGEKLIADLVLHPDRFLRVFQGAGADSMAEWPAIDRTLWPKPASLPTKYKYHWPLEPGIGWGPRPVASVITSRVCPWQCSFCNENSYIPNMGRRPVEMVIEELNELDAKYGVGSVVIHDSMFFQNPGWLERWCDKYPKMARKRWPYWAAARADTVAQWPDLFERLVRETNWRSVSIGFESGSDRVLRILNKQTTETDNFFTIDLVNRIGDEQEKAGETPARFWSNIMLAIPGELPEDAVKTIRMLKRMKRVDPSIAYYAPYPGSALGHQLIAEGKNILLGNHERNPHDKKVIGVDYGFYRRLLSGEYDSWINDGLSSEERRREIVTHGGLRLVDLVQKA